MPEPLADLADRWAREAAERERRAAEAKAARQRAEAERALTELRREPDEDQPWRAR
jgi:hypothetical protein